MMTALKKLAPLLGHELLYSPWVQRLGRVSFLGALDCHPHSHKAFSRLDHSLGVAELGLQVAESLQLPLAAMKTFVAACLRQIPEVDTVLTSERFRAAAE